MYVVRTGCAWRQLPHDFPPWQTVYWYFVRWHDEGAVARVHDALRDQVRQAEGRSAEPTAGLIDSQSIRTACHGRQRPGPRRRPTVAAMDPTRPPHRAEDLGRPGFRRGRLVDWAATALKRTVEIVRKEPGQRGFQVQPKRWAVE